MNTQKNAIVDTKYGKLEGSFVNELYSFKGIPFASPPVGELRWMLPQPPQPWQGIRPAKKFGNIAPQNIMKGPDGGPAIPGFGGEIEPQSEDCLFLNVYTPGLDKAKRPVMVWIHGGAFSIGSGSQEMFRDSSLPAKGNIVLVTINYRLGMLGFLNLNVATQGKIPSTGNEGILDQIAALKWVRDNIAAFGGDPQNVTIFGESAGGMSVACLMVIPEARGLFQKAILESAVGDIARPLDPSVKIAQTFLETAGVDASDPAAIRALSVEKILAAHQKTALKTGQGMAPMIPVADGQVMPEMPLVAFESGHASRVPTIVGSNLEEQKFFSILNPGSAKMDEADLVKAARGFVPEKDIPKLIDAYRQARTRRGEPTTAFEVFSAMNTDVMFRKVAIRIVESQCKYAGEGYNYLFTWKSPAANGALGSCHALEIGFVFGNPDPQFCGAGPQADQLSNQIQDAWMSFARTGNPSCPSLGVWPQYCEDRSTMILGRDSHVEKAVYEPERAVWETMGKVTTDKML